MGKFEINLGQEYTFVRHEPGSITPHPYTKKGISLNQKEKELLLANFLNEFAEKPIQIWMEGYRATGEHDVAQLIAAYNAKDFDAAMKLYMQDNPGDVTVDERGYTIWACKLYNNQTDARKSFG